MATAAARRSAGSRLKLFLAGMLFVPGQAEAMAPVSAASIEPAGAGGWENRCRALVPSRRPITVARNVEADDLLGLRDFGGIDASEADPPGFAVSPDGRFVAVQVRQADSDANSYCQGLLIYDLLKPGRPPELVGIGGQFVRKSFTLYGLHGFPTGLPAPLTPKWSADGRWIAFLKRDHDVTRLFVLSRLNGDVRAVSATGGDVVDFSWTGSDASLRYSQVASSAAARAAAQAGGLSGYRMDERIWTLADLTPFPTAAPEMVHHAVTLNQKQPASGAKGQPVDVLPVEPLADRAAVRIEISDGAVARLRLHRADDEIICKSELCAGVTAAWLTADASAIVFMRREGFAAAQTAIYLWRIGMPEPRRILVVDDAILGCDLQVRLICARETSSHPRDLVEIDWVGGGIRPLIDLNPEFSALKLGKIQRLKWVNKFGIETFGDLVLPPGHARAVELPLVIVQYNSRGFLRGGTGDDYPIQAMAAKGFAVLSFNRPLEYQTAMERSGRRYSKRKAVLEWSDRASVHDALLAGVDRVAAIQPIDWDHVAITGLSDGASTATYALIHSKIFSLALLSSCCEDPAILETGVGEAYVDHLRKNGYPLPWERYRSSWRRVSLAMNAKQICARILIQSADREARLALAALRELKRYGRDVDMYVFPDEYHVKWQPAHRRATYLRSADELEKWRRSPRQPCPA